MGPPKVPLYFGLFLILGLIFNVSTILGQIRLCFYLSCHCNGKKDPQEQHVQRVIPSTSKVHIKSTNSEDMMRAIHL